MKSFLAIALVAVCCASCATVESVKKDEPWLKCTERQLQEIDDIYHMCDSVEMFDIKNCEFVRAMILPRCSSI